MGVLNIQQPNVGGQRNPMGGQLAVTALEMLLKRYLDKRDANTAEAGANEFLRSEQGLPNEPQLEFPKQPAQDVAAPTTIPKPTLANPLEDLMKIPEQAAEPQKKEGPGLPTPPAKPLPELTNLLQGYQPPQEAAPAPEVQGPPKQVMPKQMVPTGMPQQYYASRMLQESRAPGLVEGTDANGNPIYVPKVQGAPVAPKAPKIQMMETPEGIRGVRVAEGLATDAQGQPLKKRNTALEARVAGAEANAAYRMKPVINTDTNTLEYHSDKTLKELESVDPGRYAQVGAYSEALGKRAFTEDIRANINGTRHALDAAPEFDAWTAGQLAAYLGDPSNPKEIGLINDWARRQIGVTMTKEQLTYIARLNNLGENLMSLRTLQKMGPGAQDQREAMRRLIPDGTTVSKQHAHEQLNFLEGTLASVERGLIKAKLNYPSHVTNTKGFTDPAIINSQWEDAMAKLEDRGIPLNDVPNPGAAAGTVVPPKAAPTPGATPAAPKKVRRFTAAGEEIL